MFFSRKKPARSYDPATQQPALRCSICTGEQVAGFKYIHTGRFSEVMLIRNAADLREFLELYDLSEGDVLTEY